MKKHIKYIIYFALSVFLIYLVFKETDVKQMLLDLKTIKPIPIFLSFIMGYIAFISRGIRWVYLINSMGYKVNTLNSINAVTIGYFVNLAVTRAGEVARCTTLHQTDKIPINKLVGTVLLERIIDLIILFFIICITFVLKFDLMMSFINQILSNKTNIEKANTKLWIFLVGMALCFFLFIYFKKQILKTKIYQKFIQFLLGLKEGLKTFKSIENKKEFIFHTLVIWVIYILMIYIVFFAIDKTSHLSFGEGLFILVVGALAMIVPVPSGIGAYHAAVMIGLMILNIDKNTSLFFATVVHTTQIFVAIFFGIIALAITSIRKVKK